jgi:ABC-type lipoprotein export system ATPase subunit
MAKALEMRDVDKAFPKGEARVQALQAISLEVGQGELVIIRGPSGSGKTTLLLTAGGLLAPDAGIVQLEGRDPYGLPPEERARLRAVLVGFVFQQFHLLSYLTVLENVMTPALALPHDDTKDRALELLEVFQLSPRADHLPCELSTGERQRTALARALLNRPRLLLADEPTGNLDPNNAAVVIGQMEAFARSGGAVLMVTHSEVAMEYTDRVLQLEEGRIA